jgi:hypothetical protein
MGALVVSKLAVVASRSWRWVSVVVSVCLCMGRSFAAEPDMAAAPLNAKYAELNKQLLNNQFQRPLVLESADSSNDLKGEIYAVIDYPYATVSTALNTPANWCDVLILNVYIKYCHAANSKAGTVLTVNLSNQHDQPLADTYRAEFKYSGAVTMPDYFGVELYAEEGPLDTHDYRIWIEATPLKDGRTFLHFTYGYGFGVIGRLTMQGYLATMGRNKVGFTVIGKQPNGRPVYTKGMRGLVERNTMRYFLAIDAYLAALATPPEQQLEKRLQLWYDDNEQYTRQLHEAERGDYLEMKRREFQGQQIVQ